MNELIKIDFTPEQVQLIKTQVAPNANDNELKLFLYQCKRTGLDPLTRQIYCIHRGGKMTIQTSIDGFRVIAERSGFYAGQDEPVYDYDDRGNIKSCKVTVYRFSDGGIRYPAATGVAFWSEYAQEYNGKLSGLWAKMPHVMIAKTAEALALRKSFPQDLSGLYTADEFNTEKESDTAEMDAKHFKPIPIDELVKMDPRPVISSISFNKAMQLASTDSTIYERTKQKYALTKEQDYMLSTAFNNQ